MSERSGRAVAPGSTTARRWLRSCARAGADGAGASESSADHSGHTGWPGDGRGEGERSEASGGGGVKWLRTVAKAEC
jgi:hypothetical protein